MWRIFGQRECSLRITAPTLRVLCTAVVATFLGILRTEADTLCVSTEPSRTPHTIIAACTSVIQSSTASDEAKAQAYRFRGAALLKNAMLDEAIADFDDGLRLGQGVSANTRSNLYRLRSSVFNRRGQISETLRDALKAVESDPEDSNAHYHLGEMYLNNHGQTDAARQSAARSIELDPTFVRPRILRARIAYTKHDDETAAMDAAVAAKSSAADCITYNFMARTIDCRSFSVLLFALAASRVNRIEEADAMINDLVKTTPTNVSYRLRGFYSLYFPTGPGYPKRLPAAIADLKKAVELNPEDDESWAELSTALGRAGSTEEALAAISVAIEKYPWPISLLEHVLHKSRLLHRLGKTDDAVTLLAEHWDKRREASVGIHEFTDLLIRAGYLFNPQRAFANSVPSAQHPMIAAALRACIRDSNCR